MFFSPFPLFAPVKIGGGRCRTEIIFRFVGLLKDRFLHPTQKAKAPEVTLALRGNGVVVLRDLIGYGTKSVQVVAVPPCTTLSPWWKPLLSVISRPIALPLCLLTML
jgi:hypothetical protein